MNKKIDEIIRNFDFDSVNKTMVALNWEWYQEGVPSVGSLVLLAQDLLRNVVESSDRFSSTGGFEASNLDGILSLKFIVSEWDIDSEVE